MAIDAQPGMKTVVRLVSVPPAVLLQIRVRGDYRIRWTFPASAVHADAAFSEIKQAAVAVRHG